MNTIIQLPGVVFASACLLLAGCGRRDELPVSLPTAPARSGTAVAILVDVSGSMNQPVLDSRGKERPKAELAREALDRIIANTLQWKHEHPDKTIELGLFTFSSAVNTVLPIAPFDEVKARAAMKAIPPPNSGTAIGRALSEGFQALYKSGCTRKFIVCITDGENTSGPRPDFVAKQLFAQSQGGVEIHFIAFDTSANHFKFLKQVNGHVVEAADGGQLEKRLHDIYDKRILAEAEEPPS